MRQSPKRGDIRSQPLDSIQIDGRGHSGLRIKLARVIPQFGEIDETVPIALEVYKLDGVKPNQRGEQSLPP